MSLDSQLAASMVSTCYRRSVTSRGAKGDPVYGTQASFLARVEKKPTRVKNAQGEEVISTSQLTTQAAVAMTDRLWLPGSDKTDDKQALVPIEVDTAYDELGGISHYQVNL